MVEGRDKEGRDRQPLELSPQHEARRPRFLLVLHKYYYLSSAWEMLPRTIFSRGDAFMLTPAARWEKAGKSGVGGDFMSLSQLLHFESSLLCSGGGYVVHRKGSASWGLAYRMALEGIIAVLSVLASPKFI